MLQPIEAKLKELNDKIQQSIANHNFLLGWKTALEQVSTDLKAAAPVAETVIAAVDPTAAPVVDAAIGTAETVVSDAS